MKTMKRFFASLVAVMLTTAMLVVPASADATHSITISGASGHTFEAYQIFTGDLSGEVLSNIDWSVNGVNGSALLTALQESAYFGPAFDSCSTAAQVATVLEGADWKETDTVEFAKIVAANLGAASGSGAESGTDYVISNLEAGYYFVKDTSVLEGANDANSRYIIWLTSSTKVAIKKAMPTLIKKVSLTPASGFSEAVSAGIGNTVYFSLTAKMHERVGDYSTYPLTFVDTLPAGMTYGDVEAVYVNTTKLDGISAVSSVSNTDNEYTFTVEDAKSVIAGATGGAAVAATDRITIVFSATINGGADWVYGGTGNKNTAVLTYPNNPSDENAKGKTAEADALIYTYQMLINKKDATTNAALSGAQFTVSFLDDGGATKYVQATGSNGVYTATGTTTDESGATTLTTNGDGQITLKGLRVREYSLAETKAPDGYNKINDAQTVTIVATINTDTGELTDLNATRTGVNTTVNGTNKSNGTVEVTIVNHQGAVLPTTGGMGTTIFYIAGGALMLGAAAILLTKKRGARG